MIHKEFYGKYVSWADETFGFEPERLPGLLVHIRKELEELSKDNYPLEEWVDVFFLAIHGVRRSGYTIEELNQAAEDKYQVNINRRWAPPDASGCVEHIRT